MAGVPVPMTQKQVGHKKLSTTEIYATVAPALVKEAYDLHGFGPAKGVSGGDKDVLNQIVLFYFCRYH